MNTPISNRTTILGGDALRWPTHDAPAPAEPDMVNFPGGVVQHGGVNLIQDTSESLPGLYPARLGADSPVQIHPEPDMQLCGIEASAADHGPSSPTFREASGGVERWAAARRLEFLLLWSATELSGKEIARFFGLSERHTRRLRVDLGLEDRTTLRRLDRAGRRRLGAYKALAGLMSQEAQALLVTAQARSRA
ncbi:MAG: hypothetical protein NDJ72_00110 [Elusimicrobia bacterium]|nr:hypothetical protein [Elusimicrobiota bacterium]